MARRAKQLEELFTPDVNFWEYVKPLGAGAYGLAVLLRQKGRTAGKPFQIAVKVGINRGEGQLRQEIEYLKTLNGAKHIVRMLGYVDKFEPSEENNFPPLSIAFDVIAAINGPMVALEYLDGGDCTWFFGRMKDKGKHPPNRILWSMFLCMIRACIAMAYPVEATIFQDAILEEVDTDRQPTKIQHNDIHPRNVMITIGDSLDEHGMGHYFKLIDFGMVNNGSFGGLGAPNNVYEVATTLIMFIAMEGRGLTGFGHHQGLPTNAAPILHHPPMQDPYPWLDPQLAGLIAECQYIDPTKRPGLNQLLVRARHAVLNKKADSFPEPQNETDEAIRKFVQDYLLNVPRPPPPPRPTAPVFYGPPRPPTGPAAAPAP